MEADPGIDENTSRFSFACAQYAHEKPRLHQAGRARPDKSAQAASKKVIAFPFRLRRLGDAASLAGFGNAALRRRPGIDCRRVGCFCALAEAFCGLDWRRRLPGSTAAHRQPDGGLAGAARLGRLCDGLRGGVDITPGDIERRKRRFRILRLAAPTGLDQT